MTPELEKYYETYFDLFMTDGWKQFIEDIGVSTKNFDIRFLKDGESLKFSQGQLSVLDQVVNWEASIRNTYDQLSTETTE